MAPERTAAVSHLNFDETPDWRILNIPNNDFESQLLKLLKLQSKLVNYPIVFDISMM